MVTPTRVGGYLLADAVETQYATPFLCDLMSTGGHMVMDERIARPDDIGKTMAEVADGVVVHIHSGDHDVPFTEREGYRIQPGDKLLMICPTPRSGQV